MAPDHCVLLVLFLVSTVDGRHTVDVVEIANKLSDLANNLDDDDRSQQPPTVVQESSRLAVEPPVAKPTQVAYRAEIEAVRTMPPPMPTTLSPTPTPAPAPSSSSTTTTTVPPAEEDTENAPTPAVVTPVSTSMAAITFSPSAEKPEIPPPDGLLPLIPSSDTHPTPAPSTGPRTEEAEGVLEPGAPDPAPRRHLGEDDTPKDNSGLRKFIDGLLCPLVSCENVMLPTSPPLRSELPTLPRVRRRVICTCKNV